jgi:hypothetical protein
MVLAHSYGWRVYHIWLDFGYIIWTLDIWHGLITFKYQGGGLGVGKVEG